MPSTTPRPAPAPALIALLLLAAAGCGGDPDLVSAVPAAGTVNYKGKPVDRGTIRFVPDKGLPAGAPIQNGRFTMTTYNEGDGAIPGPHKVEVISFLESPGKDGGEPTQRYLVPEKYTTAENSGLTVDVPPGGSTTLVVDIP